MGLTSFCGRVFGVARGGIILLCVPPAPLQARTGSSATLGRSNDNRSVVHHAFAVLEAGWCPGAIPEHTQSSLVRGPQTPTVAPPAPVMSNGQPSRYSGQASITHRCARGLWHGDGALIMLHKLTEGCEHSDCEYVLVHL
jgi:hypothetical protein